MYTDPQQELDSDTQAESHAKKPVPLLIVFILCVAFVVYAVFSFTIAIPRFPEEGITMQITKGMTVAQITNEAEERGVVQSSTVLYVLLTLLYDPTSIYAGTYSFTKPLSVFDVAKKLSQNDVDSNQVTVTIPEGVTRKDIARIAESKITNFDTTKFLELTKNNEGYLFPDTYYVTFEYTAEEFVSLLTKTFSLKISPLSEQIQASHLTEYEIITLASIIEREANSEESMRMVSGILQNRLSINMALQTDASIEYVLDKSLRELEPEDLKIDTPYNTYLYPGLTPTPIGNPGLQAISAVLNPIQSDYMFYITDDTGTFHYSETFEEHKRNIERYLR
jgi:UPF0755 protein